MIEQKNDKLLYDCIQGATKFIFILINEIITQNDRTILTQHKNKKFVSLLLLRGMKRNLK